MIVQSFNPDRLPNLGHVLVFPYVQSRCDSSRVESEGSVLSETAVTRLLDSASCKETSRITRFSVPALPDGDKVLGPDHDPQELFLRF